MKLKGLLSEPATASTTRKTFQTRKKHREWKNAFGKSIGHEKKHLLD